MDLYPEGTRLLVRKIERRVCYAFPVKEGPYLSVKYKCCAVKSDKEVMKDWWFG